MPVSGGIYYHAYQGGSQAAPAVLLIHGAGGNHLYWPSEIRRLPGARIYALDLPGHGKSSGRGHQSIEAYSQALVDWMSTAEIGRAVVVGHSMGSAIALSMALTHPELVLGLGLLGASARLRVNPEILSDSAGSTTYHKAIEALLRFGFSSFADPRLVELAGKRMLENRHSVLHGDLMACDAFDVIDRVSQIKQPAFVLCGAEDLLTPVRYSQFLAGVLSNSRLSVIPEAGHMVMLEKPQEVAGALANFLPVISPAQS
jgi:pimeloyl-ACP methyl ester carboxylesterase